MAWVQGVGPALGTALSLNSFALLGSLRSLGSLGIRPCYMRTTLLKFPNFPKFPNNGYAPEQTTYQIATSLRSS